MRTFLILTVIALFAAPTSVAAYPNRIEQWHEHVKNRKPECALSTIPYELREQAQSEGKFALARCATGKTPAELDANGCIEIGNLPLSIKVTRGKRVARETYELLQWLIASVLQPQDLETIKKVKEHQALAKIQAGLMDQYTIELLSRDATKRQILTVLKELARDLGSARRAHDLEKQKNLLLIRKGLNEKLKEYSSGHALLLEQKTQARVEAMELERKADELLEQTFAGNLKVTEAWNPTYRHDAVCHNIGCAVDFSVLGGGQSQLKKEDVWELLRRTFAESGETTLTSALCYARDEYVCPAPGASAGHFHIESFTQKDGNGQEQLCGMCKNEKNEWVNCLYELPKKKTP